MGAQLVGSSTFEVAALVDEPRGSADVGDPDPPTTSGVPEMPAIPSTRAARNWMRVLPALVLLAVTVVFVAQNLHSAKVSFFAASGRVPLAVALLAAFALGALVVLALGSVRIIQLRHLVRRATHERPRRKP